MKYLFLQEFFECKFKEKIITLFHDDFISWINWTDDWNVDFLHDTYENTPHHATSFTITYKIFTFIELSSRINEKLNWKQKTSRQIEKTIKRKYLNHHLIVAQPGRQYYWHIHFEKNRLSASCHCNCCRSLQICEVNQRTRAKHRSSIVHFDTFLILIFLRVRSGKKCDFWLVII